MATQRVFPKTHARNQHADSALPPQAADSEQLLDVSIVIPLLNEEENLERLYLQLDDALAALGRTYEIVFVDDGSTDDSFAVLETLAQRDEHVRVVRLRRNFGQTAAFSAGFDIARGRVIITMDADLQNDPADIPRLLDKMAEGYDVVSGWRVKRQDQLVRRKLPSRLANALISRMTGVRLHDYGCSLKAYDREVIKNVKLYGEMHRFIPALASWMGVRVAEIPVNHRARQFGRSKYGLSRVTRVILDLLLVKFLLNYSTRPIQVFGLAGILSLGLGTAVGLYLSAQKIFWGQSLADRPLLLLAVMLVVLGVQLIMMGLLGELMVRTYYEAQNKPIYAVRQYASKAPEPAAEAMRPLPQIGRNGRRGGGEPLLGHGNGMAANRRP
ncbi:MAG: glycosyltransferase family 2 protein [Chloroflexota bacterium]